MIEIIPAIIAENYKELEDKIKAVEPYVKWVQLDVSDGKFAPSITFNDPAKLKDLNTDLELEAHLMVAELEKDIDFWLASPIKRILVHYESTRNIQKLIKKIKSAGREVGIVLKLETLVEVIDDFIRQINTVQLMSIAEIGYYGRKFDDRVLEKIRIIRKKYPEIPIAVDGGINPEIAQKVVVAGASRLIVGGYIFSSENTGETINNLKKSIE